MKANVQVERTKKEELSECFPVCLKNAYTDLMVEAGIGPTIFLMHEIVNGRDVIWMNLIRYGMARAIPTISGIARNLKISEDEIINMKWSVSARRLAAIRKVLGILDEVVALDLTGAENELAKIGYVVRERIQAIGLSDQDIAEKTGLSKREIDSAKFTYPHDPVPQFVKNISKEYKIPLLSLLLPHSPGKVKYRPNIVSFPEILKEKGEWKVQKTSDGQDTIVDPIQLLTGADIVRLNIMLDIKNKNLPPEATISMETGSLETEIRNLSWPIAAETVECLRRIVERLDIQSYRLVELMHEKRNIGAFIKEEREKAGFSIQRMAEAVDVSWNKITFLEEAASIIGYPKIIDKIQNRYPLIPLLFPRNAIIAKRSPLVPIQKSHAIPENAEKRSAFMQGIRSVFKRRGL